MCLCILVYITPVVFQSIFRVHFNKLFAQQGEEDFPIDIQYIHLGLYGSFLETRYKHFYRIFGVAPSTYPVLMMCLMRFLFKKFKLIRLAW